jgi:hypothetical protein
MIVTNFVDVIIIIIFNIIIIINIIISIDIIIIIIDSN